jgi:hypothetical protein
MKTDQEPTPPKRSPRRFSFTAAFFTVLGLGLALFAWQSLTPRVPGMPATGSMPGMVMTPSPPEPASSAGTDPMAGMDMGGNATQGANSAPPTGNLAVLEGDLHALMVAEDGRLFYGQHAGVQVSKDGGATWSAPSGGGDAMGMGGAGDKLFLAGHDFFSVSRDGGASWRNPGFGNLPGTDIHGFAVAPNGWLYANLAGRGLYRSTDGGAGWTAVTQATMSAMTLQATAGSPVTLYANAIDQGVIRSQDGGRTWQLLTSALEGRASSFTVDPQSGALLVATGEGKLLRSDNNGDAWTALNAPEALALLAVSPKDSKLIYAVGGSNQVYRSSDGGQTWNGR